MPPITLVVNRLAPFHLDRCASTDGDAAYRLPPGTRVTVVQTGVDYCTRVRVAVPSEGEVTGLVAAARLSRLDGQRDPDAVVWANVNPALATKPEIAAAKEERSKKIADDEDLKRWEHERMTSFCPDPRINMGIVEVTTGDDKMRAALALATCTDEKQRHLATQLLDQIVDQCFQTHEWKRNCPRRVSVEDQRQRLAAPDHAN